jgi:hypothetical protein
MALARRHGVLTFAASMHPAIKPREWQQYYLAVECPKCRAPRGARCDASSEATAHAARARTALREFPPQLGDVIMFDAWLHASLCATCLIMRAFGRRPAHVDVCAAALYGVPPDKPPRVVPVIAHLAFVVLATREHGDEPQRARLRAQGYRWQVVDSTGDPWRGIAIPSRSPCIVLTRVVPCDWFVTAGGELLGQRCAYESWPRGAARLVAPAEAWDLVGAARRGPRLSGDARSVLGGAGRHAPSAAPAR